MNLVIDVQYGDELAEGSADVPSSAEFERWATAALAAEREVAELTLRVVGSVEGTELNQNYRGRTGPTNVLSLPVDSPVEVEWPLLGDVVICATVVTREAREQNKPAAAHWAHMTVHGVLHLLGYDHEHAAQADEMARHEARILVGLGFADPYAAERRRPLPVPAA